ncbi:hypothetical protein MP477_13210 [Chryseobacterium sp. WG23]|uniref:hypothetical protein n=1 Tax=Chryseobacterium sp. WG23 TaxID=2926910 RepID=UPI00211EC697|nr:hypothetical protein [Chryseobacterium sp. WG23]MCQ9635911.1 hypothetical protein [Chryseobacterium sp. WG23]
MDKETKDFLSTILVFVVMCILIVVGVYACNLAGNGISKDPEKWGQFGDYFGGVLNPILTIFNLVLVGYLTLKISSIEDNRSKNIMYENVRPLGLFSFELSKNSLKIHLHNVGVGPLIINEFKTYNEIEKKEVADFYELINSLSLPAVYAYSGRKSSDQNIISKDGFMKILEISITEDSKGFDYIEKLKIFNEIREKIGGYKLKATYTDLYGKLIETKEEDLNQINIEFR